MSVTRKAQRDEQIRVIERRLAELRSQRTAVLLELADAPDSDSHHSAVEAYDRSIHQLEARLTNIADANTAAGRAAQAAARLKLREEGEAKVEQATDIIQGPMVEAAKAVDEAIASLRSAVDRYRAVTSEARALAYAGLRPLVDDTYWQRRDVLMNLREYHGTLNTVVDVLNTREGRELRLAEHARRVSDRVVPEIYRALHHSSKEATE